MPNCVKRADVNLFRMETVCCFSCNWAQTFGRFPANPAPISLSAQLAASGWPRSDFAGKRLHWRVSSRQDRSTRNRGTRESRWSGSDSEPVCDLYDAVCFSLLIVNTGWSPHSIIRRPQKFRASEVQTETQTRLQRVCCITAMYSRWTRVLLTDPLIAGASAHPEAYRLPLSIRKYLLLFNRAPSFLQ